MVGRLSTGMRAQCRVTFKIDHDEISVEADEQTSILELALENDIEISHSCGGNATCGTCRVFVENNVDKLPPRDSLEKEMAEERGFQRDERLSCQLSPMPDL